MFKQLFICLLLIGLAQPLVANPMRPDPLSTQPQVRSTTTKPVVKTVRLPTLENIIIIGDYRKAVFRSNREVSEGDMIGSFQLLQVNKDSVVLKRGQQLKTLFLKTSGEVSITPVKED
jgi:hypothetical protein